jgi:hypothetical protein
LLLNVKKEGRNKRGGTRGEEQEGMGKLGEEDVPALLVDGMI